MKLSMRNISLRDSICLLAEARGLLFFSGGGGGVRASPWPRAGSVGRLAVTASSTVLGDAGVGRISTQQ
jgi:hypothetical protein